MSRATQEMRDFARRLMALEASETKTPRTRFPADFSFADKLRPPLASLMGHAGYRALVSRSLVLAHTEVPWLREARVKTDGSLELTGDIGARVDPEEILQGRVVLIAQLLGLLVAFIGQNLTLRLVGDAWPKLSLADLDFGKGSENEGTR